jgi:hypothetical protein
VFARRADMIGKYLGQTAPKTQQIIDSALGGVLFLDEVYELGDTEGRDMFGKECINVINRNLSEHAGEFVCIVAGYREQIESCFFAHNSGLERRFPYRFTIEPYTPAEMCEIFRVIVEREGWKIDGGGGGVLPPSTSPSTSFFTANQQYFKFMGGDIEVFFQKCKIAHVSRIFGIHGAPVRILNAEDIDAGMELFKSNPNVSNRNNHDNDALSSMYM